MRCYYLLRNRDKLKTELGFFWQRTKFDLLRRFFGLKNFSLAIDQSYCAVWDYHDLISIQREYDLIRNRLIPPNTLSDKLKRYWQDQTVYFQNSTRYFEPLDLRRTIDKITNEYLSTMVKIHTGNSSDFPDYIGVGTDNTTAKESDTDLVAELSRLNLIDSGGFADFAGHTEFYGVLFPFNQGTTDIGESGLMIGLDPTADILVCRNTYNPKLHHDANNDAIGVNVNIQHRGF